MFYDFIAHQTDPAYQAATLLIPEMLSQKTARRYLEALASPDLREILLHRKNDDLPSNLMPISV